MKRATRTFFFTARYLDSALKLIKENIFDLIIMDIRIGKSNGIHVLISVQKILPDTSIGSYDDCIYQF